MGSPSQFGSFTTKERTRVPAVPGTSRPWDIHKGVGKLSRPYNSA